MKISKEKREELINLILSKNSKTNLKKINQKAKKGSTIKEISSRILNGK
jgi:hypothetical protein